MAETFAQLAARETEFPAFAVFNFGGYWDEDGRQMIAAIGRAVGNPAIKVKPLPWTILAIAAPFNETLRELVKMKQFWRMPVRLDNARLIAFLGAEPHTSLDQAVAATLAGLGVSGRK